MGSYDPVGYALAIDALTHSGTADAGRIARTVCSQPYQPGVNPATFVSDYATYLAVVGADQAQAPEVNAEPPLRCYVFDACPVPAPGSSRAQPRTGHHRAHRPRHRARRHHTRHRRHAVHRRRDRRPDRAS
jgi:hypothetical protein